MLFILWFNIDMTWVWLIIFRAILKRGGVIIARVGPSPAPLGAKP